MVASAIAPEACRASSSSSQISSLRTHIHTRNTTAVLKHGRRIARHFVRQSALIAWFILFLRNKISEAVRLDFVANERPNFERRKISTNVHDVKFTRLTRHENAGSITSRRPSIGSRRNNDRP